MERKIIIATHGNFAEGIKTSLELICGEVKNVETLCAYMSENFDLAKSVSDILEKNRNFELIIVTDLFGGSVNNEFFKYINQPNTHLIAGLNLSLLIELYTQLAFPESVEVLIQTILPNAQDSMKYCNVLTLEESEEEF